MALVEAVVIVAVRPIVVPEVALVIVAVVVPPVVGVPPPSVLSALSDEQAARPRGVPATRTDTMYTRGNTDILLFFATGRSLPQIG